MWLGIVGVVLFVGTDGRYASAGVPIIGCEYSVFGTFRDESVLLLTDAQQAVDHLADNDFPVRGLTVVGIDPALVERVDAHLTWQRVLATGAASGAWLGLFVGLLLSMFTMGAGLLPIMIGLLFGVVFGVAMAAVRYASARGQQNTGPATTTYIKASLQEVATALATMTGQPHPMADP